MGRRWDAVLGISVGAVNALQIAMYAPKDQLEGARELERFWLAIKGNETIYRNWTIPVIEGLLGKGSIYDTAPLESFLRARFKPDALKASGVKLRLGATNLRTGKLVYGHEKSADVVKWVMASSAFPAAFTPIALDGDLWIDGGVRDTIPIAEAVHMGATEMDIVLTGPRDGETYDWDQKRAGNAALVGIRSAEIMANEVFKTDQNVLKNYKGRVRVYAPYAPWTTDPLDFDPKAIRHKIDVGYGIP
jgi:NTE family protein